jgi:hypothetical protein
MTTQYGTIDHNQKYSLLLTTIKRKNKKQKIKQASHLPIMDKQLSLKKFTNINYNKVKLVAF